MTWWLTVFFYINGTWVAGATIEGWHPRPYPTEAVCLERKAFAERECRSHPLSFDTFWICTEGAPAAEPPQGPPTIDC